MSWASSYISLVREIVLKNRWSILVVGLAFLLSLTWFLPPARAVLVQTYQSGQEYAARLAGEAPAPTPNTELVRQGEQLTEMEHRLQTTEQELGLVKQALVDNQNQFKQVIAEVGETNDVLNQRQIAWLAALKKISPLTAMALDTAEATSSTESPASSRKATASPAPSGPLNLNTATLEQLQTLPGIGGAYAQRIIDYRTQSGSFKSVEDLQQIKGIGPSTFAKLKELVTV